MDCCYISHWTVATYHTGLLLHITLDCGSPFGIILQRIVTYLAYLAILRTSFSQLFHINVRQKSPPYLRIYVSYLAYLNISVHIDTGLTCLAYQHIFVHISTVLIHINNILMFSPYRLRLSNVQNI